MSSHDNDAAHRDAAAREMNRESGRDTSRIDSHASPDVIESQIDAKRADISRTLSQLEQRFSPNQVVDYVKDNGGEIADNLGRSFKRNPVPFVITGIGLAWLMSSTRDSGSNEDADYRRYRSLYYGDNPKDRFDDDYGYDAAYAPAYDAEYSSNRAGGVTDTTPYAAAPSGTAYASGSAGSYASGSSAATSGSSKDDGPSLLDKARAKASEIGDEIGEGVDSLKEKAGALRDDASDRMGQARRSSSEHYERMRSDAGYRAHHLRMDAENRYDSLRGSGRDAAARARRNMQNGMERTTDYLQEQPLVAAALGVGIGALIGSLLPATRTEDRYLGEYSDEVRDEASHIASEQAEHLSGEVQKVAKQASESVQDGIVQARETVETELKHAREQAESGVEEAGDKVDEKSAEAETKADEKLSDRTTTG